MKEKHPVQQHSLPPCPAGDDNCPNLTEVERLRKEISNLAAMVRTDELTGLFNFRYFTQALSLEMERTRRSGQPTCLIMLDIDHFKEINDVHGHEVGNRVLSFISGLILNSIRRLDIPCRYGGEEFALILPDTTLEQGVRFADRLRKAIGNTTIKIGELKVKVKASFGVDVYENGDEVSEKGFVEQVDGYLYNAKQQGRDRVCNREFIPAFMKTSDKAG